MISQVLRDARKYEETAQKAITREMTCLGVPGGFRGMPGLEKAIWTIKKR